ncbi:hypothetical protein EMGBS10_20670 [Opitutia bacterium]|jgi:hypothetical protein|nr:hypothetical protein EMGBS10_20670 [Opitutae bacterium]
MARKLFVFSALSLAFVGCMGPKKGPSPVNDGPAAVAPAILVPIDTGLTPVTPVAPAKPTPAKPTPAKPTTPAKKSTGKLPLGNNVGNK